MGHNGAVSTLHSRLKWKRSGPVDRRPVSRSADSRSMYQHWRNAVSQSRLCIMLRVECTEAVLKWFYTLVGEVGR